MGKPQSKLTSSYVKSPLESQPQVANLLTIPERLRYFADHTPGKDAVVFVSTEGPRQSVTFKELYEKSIEAAKKYVNLGVKKDEHVAINIRPCPEWLYTTIGAMMAGMRPISVSFTYKDGSDIVALVDKIQTCSCIILDPGYEGENWAIFSNLLDSYAPDGSMKSNQMPYLRYLIVHDPNNEIKGAKTLTDFLTENVPDVSLPEITEHDVAVLFQTSGSTGVPKLVVHTHRAAVSIMNYSLDSSAFSFDYTYYNDRPFNWYGGFPFGVFDGQTRVTLSGFCEPPKDKAAFVFNVIKEEYCQVMLGHPVVLLGIFHLIKDNPTDAWPLKILIAGGMPIPRQIVAVLMRVCKYAIVLYAGTEFGLPTSITVSNSDDFEDFSCGYVNPGYELKIVDKDGEIVPTNQSGEIYVKGNTVFSKYLNDPEKTTAVLTEDSWYKTDDMGEMKEDGSLRILGRKSMMIISGGMNVNPEIQENLLRKCPGVESVVLVPIPDEVLYQVVCACVKLIPGSDANESTVRKFCEDAHGDKLSLFTVLPKYFLIFDTFPETISGKVSRATLTKLARDKLKL